MALSTRTLCWHSRVPLPCWRASATSRRLAWMRWVPSRRQSDMYLSYMRTQSTCFCCIVFRHLGRQNSIGIGIYQHGILLFWGGKRWKSGILTVFLDKLVNPLGVSKQARIAASVIFFVVGFVSLLIGAVLAWSVSDPMAHLRCLPTTFFHGGSGTRLENCGYQDNANA